jgi:hypothetical protein
LAACARSERRDRARGEKTPRGRGPGPRESRSAEARALAGSSAGFRQRAENEAAAC